MNKLEEYLNQRTQEREKKRRRILAAVIATLVLCGVAIGAYIVLAGEGGLVSREHSPDDSSKPVDEPPASSPEEQPVTLAVAGKFEVGYPLEFIIQNSDGQAKHHIDFGDSREMDIRNRTKHVYRRAGDYKIQFKPAGGKKAVVEIISIKKQSGSPAEYRTFAKVLEGFEAKENRKAFGAAADVDAAASFPGGVAALMAYLQTHIGTVSGHKGRVLVSFDIAKDGAVSNVSVMDGLGRQVDLQVLSAFKGMPDWIPAQKQGRNVASTYQLPFYFHKES